MSAKKTSGIYKSLLAWGLVIVMATVTAPDASSYSGGISADDSKNGCVCHSGSPASDVTVELSGLPATYETGASYELTITLSGGPVVSANATNQGGFTLKASGGDLSPLDSGTQEMEDGSLTHNAEGNDQRKWEVEWVAPADDSLGVSFTLRGNAVNGDGEPSEEDHWNEAEYTSRGGAYEEESPGLSGILTMVLLLGIACRRRLRY